MDNVRTIGYVATTWCTKNVSSVLDEVAVYAGWGNRDSSLAMGGIFFDETPTLYTPEYVSYLQTISQAVHRNHGLKDGFVGKRSSFISALGVFCGFPVKPEVGGSRYMVTPHYIAYISSRVLWFCSWESRNWGSSHRQL